MAKIKQYWWDNFRWRDAVLIWFRIVGVAHVAKMSSPRLIFNFSNVLHRIPPIVAAVFNA
jgi:hypothetical protein